jgi:hypothetical protein
MKEITNKYLIGAKLGDLIHGLLIPNYVYEKTGIKADIIIGEIGDKFTTGLDQTFDEVKKILEVQDFVSSVEKYDSSNPLHLQFPEFYDYDSNIQGSWNIANFRSSSLCERVGWMDFYFMTYLPTENVPYNYKWLSSSVREDLSDVTLINFQTSQFGRPSPTHNMNRYQQEIDEAEKAMFICFNVEQHNLFPLKEKLPVLHVHDLYEMLVCINSCKRFVGNLSAPMDMATAVNKRRTLEWPYVTYAGDVRHYDNLDFLQS